MAILDTKGVGWKELFKRTVKEFSDDDMEAYSCALAFQGFFSMFPFLLFLMAMLSFLHVPQFFDWLREEMAQVVPPAAMDQINPIIDQWQQQEAGLLSLGILVALWTASSGVRSMMNAMNKAYDVEDGRPAWKRFPLSVLYTVGIAIMLLTAAAIMIMGPDAMEWLAGYVGLQDAVITVWTWIRWPIAILLMMLLVAVLYYMCPDVDQDFAFVTPGSALAVLVWLLASLAFGWYVQNFADYDALYGSVGAIIALLMFFYISSMVLLFGAEMNAVIEHASTEGKDPGEKQLD